MKKKLLVFTGSPRKDGNSTILALEAARAAREAGASVEVINLARLKINPCRACDRCRDRGPGECLQKDDMKKLYPRLKEAEAIILAHPVYWFTINAQTKLFIDRWYAFGGDEYASFKNKKVGLILTYADRDVFSSGGVNALRAYQDIFGYLGVEIKGMVYASAASPGQVRKQPGVLKEAYNLGKDLMS
ncbi:MAG: Iron-sulfur flavoprotein [Candidatus Saccharicenans subterraneus]|uniref:Iron-sulfur flavoprotein n=1 Tax=Candidatus Saccharicenans subterraneus TaxID=2508984 RepID=A0A3E2BPQ3_9BACT|nr:MAG: Iron-sulfur flavoprotein [Candidatus Saccharicenans subterraneum]